MRVGKTGPMKQIATWISLEDAARLEALAKEADVSLSKLMMRMLRKGMAEMDKQPKGNLFLSYVNDMIAREKSVEQTDKGE
jgi:hypothetical protein